MLERLLLYFLDKLIPHHNHHHKNKCNNHAEHEVLAGRKLDYNFVGARIVNDYSHANRKHQDYSALPIL